MSTNSLLDGNAHVCSILPSIAPGLLTKVDYIDTIYSYLDKHARANAHDPATAGRLRKIRVQLDQLEALGTHKEKKVIQVDHDKAVLLAYTFGAMYSEALALVTGNGIHTEVFDEDQLDTSELKSISDSYWTSRGKVPVFVRVLHRPVITSDQPDDSNVFLQLRRMVGEIGLTLNLETFDVEVKHEKKRICEDERSGGNERICENESIAQNERIGEVKNSGEIKSIGENELCENKTTGETVKPEPTQPNIDWVRNQPSVTVNVYNWYCSCEDFSRQITRPHNSTSRDILRHVSCPIMANWFAHSWCNHITPLPVCMHLLAVVIGVYNRAAVEIPVRLIEATEI